jgi:hypothetical protein
VCSSPNLCENLDGALIAFPAPAYFCSHLIQAIPNLIAGFFRLGGIEGNDQGRRFAALRNYIPGAFLFHGTHQFRCPRLQLANAYFLGLGWILLRVVTYVTTKYFPSRNSSREW